MRIPTGSTDRYIYFVAVDATDMKTREAGLDTFTVWRSRNGLAAVAMTTPTINETNATYMPGVYELLLDEDTTLTAGNDTEEMVSHITHAGMAPVTRVVELYRPETTEGHTLSVTSGVCDHVQLVDLCDTTATITNLPTGFAAATFPSAVASTTLSASVLTDIEDAVLDADLSGHAVAGTAGVALTDIGTVKTATDKLAFTVANQVDANIQSINDATVTGDGNATPWDGA